MLRKLLLGVVLLLLVLAGAVYFFADRMLASDLVRTQLEQQLTTRIGQPVHIKSIAASVFPSVAVHLQDVAVGAQTVHVDLDAAVDGDRLAISRLLLRGKRTSIEASGALASIARLQGTIDANAKSLDLDEVLAIASAFTAAGPQAPSPAPTKAAEIVPMHIIAKIAAAS